jgi:hypothetical protein
VGKARHTKTHLSVCFHTQKPVIDVFLVPRKRWIKWHPGRLQSYRLELIHKRHTQVWFIDVGQHMASIPLGPSCCHKTSTSNIYWLGSMKTCPNSTVQIHSELGIAPSTMIPKRKRKDDWMSLSDCHDSRHSTWAVGSNFIDADVLRHAGESRGQILIP